MKIRVVCCAALVGLLISPAMAAITVTLQPFDGGNDAYVYANIPAGEEIVGFGFDAVLDGPGLVFDHFAPAAPFSAVSTPDGDGIAGLTLFPTVPGNVLLGTLYFNGTGEWVSPRDDYPVDLTEGFALATPGQFAEVTYVPAYVPEPAALTLLALGGLALLRRR